MSDPDYDANHIRNVLVTIVIMAGLIGFGIILYNAATQKPENKEYGCVYDPRNGNKYCQQAP